jgi:hypothetical protein
VATRRKTIAKKKVAKTTTRKRPRKTAKAAAK